MVDLSLRVRERALLGLDRPHVLLDDRSGEDVEVESSGRAWRRADGKDEKSGKSEVWLVARSHEAYGRGLAES